MIAYYRVSTDKQGRSGLGLDAQASSVSAYSDTVGSSIIAAYTEIESGKNNERPELAKALAHAKRIKSVLVIAKMDRLSRNVHFVSGLLESGVTFVACDNPNANRLTIHILATVAEDEARRISERTKSALAAFKARGGLLGASRTSSRNLTLAARKRGANSNRVGASARDQIVRTRVGELRASGCSLREIATALNDAGERTAPGSIWSPMQIKRVLDRVGLRPT